MPLPPFRDLKDPDEKRREIVWIALSFIVILASWLSVVLIFGYNPLIMGMTYDEVVLLTGLALLVFCTIIYLAAREREQRAANQTLVAQLNGAVASLDERVEQLNGLCLTSAELAGALDMDHISRCVVEAVAQALRTDVAYMLLFDQQNGKLLYEHTSPPAAGMGGLASLDPDLPLDRSGEGVAMEGRLDPSSKTRATLHALMRLKDGIFGVLGARRREERDPFAPDEERVLATLANMTAKAIESAQLHAELRENYLATVRSLVNSLHERDNYTASHGARVTSLAVHMAEHLGLAESMIRDIEVFGPLHDVGKIGIRDAILMKAGPLSEPERAVCREHCVIGERILRPLRPSREALAMVRNHHESWDGRGYPDGLAGENIPLLARLLQVADSYDAMVSERPYQPAMSEQEVVSHFRQYAGVLYDPPAVEALCSVIAGAERPRPAADAAEAVEWGILPGISSSAVQHRAELTSSSTNAVHHEGPR